MRSFVTVTPQKIREYNQVTEYKVGWTCSTHETKKLLKKMLIRKDERKRERADVEDVLLDGKTVLK